MRVIFFGASEFALPSLEALFNAPKVKLVAIITEIDKPAGRKLVLQKSPVKILAEELKLNLMQPEKLDKKCLGEIKKLNPDVAVLVAYGKKIPEELLNIPLKGFVNIHPSLLPKYRGPSPIQSAILNSEAETGVSIIVLDKKIDHGPIIGQKIIEIERNENSESLSKRLAISGAELLVDTLPKYVAGKIKPRQQDDKKATYTKLLNRNDGKINWEKSANEIERMIRAHHSWPGAWFLLEEIGRVKVTEAKILHPKIGCAGNPTPGHIFKTEQKKMAINCKPGSLIIEKLVPEGKKEMTGEEFLRGYRGG